MKQIKISCDVCGKEINPKDGIGALNGALVRVDANFNRKVFEVVHDFCNNCLEIILSFVVEFKKDVAGNKTNKSKENTQNNKS